MSVLKFGIAYFESEWSFAQFRLPEIDTNVIVSFGQNIFSIIVITIKGKLYEATFDPNLGGECKKTFERDLTKKYKNDNDEENK